MMWPSRPDPSVTLSRPQVQTSLPPAQVYHKGRVPLLVNSGHLRQALFLPTWLCHLTNSFGGELGDEVWRSARIVFLTVPRTPGAGLEDSH